jgi:hypothetical protein
MLLYWGVQLEKQLDSGTLERLEKQSRLPQRIHQAGLSKSPSSRAAGVSRSNMIALRHPIELMYGEAALKPKSWDGHA